MPCLGKQCRYGNDQKSMIPECGHLHCFPLPYLISSHWSKCWTRNPLYFCFFSNSKHVFNRCDNYSYTILPRKNYICMDGYAHGVTVIHLEESAIAYTKPFSQSIYIYIYIIFYVYIGNIEWPDVPRKINMLVHPLTKSGPIS